MKNKFFSFLIVFITIVLIGCGGSSSPQPKEKKTVVSGVVQKGPFLQGSIAKIFKLDGSYERTSQMLETTISSNDGSYSFDDISWSGFSEIEVTGRFLNENTGDNTQSATVTSVVNVLADGTVNTNVNVLTHMASSKVKELLKEGKTLDEANNQVVGEVFNILGRTDLGIGDFGDLDLEDILGSNATANTELLFLSAALLRSDDYMADLEALLALYKDGGIDAILGSTIYARLMQNRQEIDESVIVANIAPDDTDVQTAVIVVPPMAVITKVALSDTINLQLYGTKFTSKTPSINLVSSGGTVTKGAIVVTEDNKSATIEISGDIGDCSDVNVTTTIEYLDLKEVTTPLQSNKINMHSSTVICMDSNGDGTATIQLPSNKPPVAIIGMMDNAEDGQQAPQSITVAVGAVVSGLETYYSYDQDSYPSGGITHCEYKDVEDEVLKSSNSNECGIYDKVFDVAGEYIYTLTVTDNRGATNSNTVTINVEGNNIPQLTLNPSANQEIIVDTQLSITATATDADAGDTLSYAWTYKIVGSSTSYSGGTSPIFTRSFDTAGEYIVSLRVSDSQGASVTKEVNVTVSNPNDEMPVARIGESNTTVNQEIYAGNAPYAMAGGTDDNGIDYCKWSHNGVTVFENSITTPQTYLDYNNCLIDFPVLTTVGNYIYTLTVRDTIGQEDTNDLNVTVLANATPTANIGANRNLEVGATLAITAVVNDTDGDDMTYQWMYGVKDSGSMTGAGSILDFSHQFDDVGLYEVTFRVADEHNAKVTVKIDVNVTEVSPDLTGIVSVGSLMWEDTAHVKGNGNYVTWSEAEAYCAGLTLGSFGNWRLPHSTMNQGGSSEVVDIRVGATNDNNNTIIDGFTPIYQSERVAIWTDEDVNENFHVAMIFQYDAQNGDSFEDDNEEVNVRCVRDAK